MSQDKPFHTGDVFDPSAHPSPNPSSEYLAQRYEERLKAEAKPKKKKRIFMWFFLAVQALFVLWIILGISGTDTAEICSDQTFNEFYTLADCQAAAGAGAGIGVGLVFVTWLVIDMILVMGWAVTKLARR